MPKSNTSPEICVFLKIYKMFWRVCQQTLPLLFLNLLHFPLVLAFPNIKTLDFNWENRQTPEGQRILIDLLTANESIPDDFETAWRVARIVYFVGNFGLGYETLPKDKRISIFKYGYEAANIARKMNPERVEGYYWYATNLGAYGIAKGKFSALSYADDARMALLTAIKIDPTYHWGGPYRVLGRFYQEVPSFISFGDKKKAEECFNKALQIAPDFRLNMIDLGVLKRDLGNNTLALKLLNEAREKPKVDGIIEEKRYLAELEKGIQKLKMEEE